MTRPRLLDLFCGAGGCSVGYHRAGFDVIGVDIEPQPDYPYPFLQDDAIEVLRRMTPGADGAFHAIHASPPCQHYSTLTKGTNAGRRYPDLIATTRLLLDRTGLPYVIENVPAAPIRKDVVLCGEMFGLGVIRHRHFELSGFDALQPAHMKHRGRVAGWRHGRRFDGPYVAVYGDGGGKGSVREWQQAMGVDWTDNRKSLAEAIPPAYGQFIGEQLLAHLQAVA